MARVEHIIALSRMRIGGMSGRGAPSVPVNRAGGQRGLLSVNSVSRFEALPLAPSAVHAEGIIDQQRLQLFRQHLTGRLRQFNCPKPEALCEKYVRNIRGIDLPTIRSATRMLSCAISAFIGEDPYVVVTSSKMVAGRSDFLGPRRSDFYIWQHCINAGLARPPVQYITSDRLRSAHNPSRAGGEIPLSHPRLKYLVLDDAAFSGQQLKSTLFTVARAANELGPQRVCVATVAMSRMAFDALKTHRSAMHFLSPFRIPEMAEVFSTAELAILGRVLPEGRQLAPVATHYHLHDCHSTHELPYADSITDYRPLGNRSTVNFRELVQREIPEASDRQVCHKMLFERVRWFLGESALSTFRAIVEAPNNRVIFSDIETSRRHAMVIPIEIDNQLMRLILRADGSANFIAYNPWRDVQVIEYDAKQHFDL